MGDEPRFDLLTELVAWAFTAAMLAFAFVVVGVLGWIWQRIDDILWKRRWQRWFERGSKDE